MRGEDYVIDQGKGSGFDLNTIKLQYHELSPGLGGKVDSNWVGGGGGGGILVDGLGPDRGPRVGEGYGGGGPGAHSPSNAGSSGFIIIEI